MTIDTSGLSEEQKATYEFKSVYAGMMRQLSAPGFIPALCAHEAAHLIFYEMMGKIRYELEPPKITYDVRRGEFIGHLAAVKLIERPECEPDKWQRWITMAAEADVAGAVVGRKLFPSGSGGEEGDKETFTILCNELVTHFGGITIDVEGVWTQAQRRVERRLVGEPRIMELIQQRAIELRPLFGL